MLRKRKWIITKHREFIFFSSCKAAAAVKRGTSGRKQRTISSKCSRGEWQNQKQKDVLDGQVDLIDVQNKRAHTRLTKTGKNQSLTNQFHSHVNEQLAFKSLCFLLKTIETFAVKSLIDQHPNVHTAHCMQRWWSSLGVPLFGIFCNFGRSSWSLWICLCCFKGATCDLHHNIMAKESASHFSWGFTHCWSHKNSLQKHITLYSNGAHHKVRERWINKKKSFSH